MSRYFAASPAAKLHKTYAANQCAATEIWIESFEPDLPKNRAVATPSTPRRMKDPSVSSAQRVTLASGTPGASAGAGPSGLVLCVRLLEERRLHGLRVRHGLVDGDRDEHLHRILVVLRLDREVPVEDRLVVLHRAQDDFLVERVHVRLVDQLDDLLVLRLLDPLLRAITRVDVGLHEIRRFLERLLQRVADGDGDGAAEDTIPRFLVLHVEDRLAELLLLRFPLPLGHGHDRVELPRLESAKHGYR